MADEDGRSDSADGDVGDRSGQKDDSASDHIRSDDAATDTRQEASQQTRYQEWIGSQILKVTDHASAPW